LSPARAETSQPPDLRERLKDPSPTVRQQAALTLAEANDADAIPVLIDLLAELPADEGKTIEDYLTRLAGSWTPAFPSTGADEKARKQRRDVWRKWWRDTDGKAQLAVIHQHTPTPERRRKVKALVEQLGDDAFTTREAADKALHRLGRIALPQLRQARANTDAEIARRARHLIERIELDPKRNLPSAAVRLLALRKPPGVAAALLAYSPLVEEENLLEEVNKALAALALRDGKLDAALRQGLSDEQAQVRTVAAEALVRGGGREGRAAVRKLLREDTPSVRLRIALALTQMGDKDAVQVLIDLLAALADEQVGEAEEVLNQLAGDTPPELPSGADSADKKKRRQVWAAWWKANASRIDPTRLAESPLLGYTVICDNFGGRVFEIDRRGKERWSIGGLQIPLDAIVLPGNRVLIAEYQANRVAERDFKGKILWQKRIVGPVNAQRLPNGHTFIAAENGPIVEVDRAGKEIYAIKNVPGRLLAAYRWPRGDIVCKTVDGQCRILDTNGKQLKSFVASHDAQSTAGLDLRANGHILITRQAAGKVVEFDRQGKAVLELNTPVVGCASQSPNGRVLVPDYQNKRVYEIDRAGKTVWEYKGNGHFIRARRR
jgi:HEAT repeat protein